MESQRKKLEIITNICTPVTHTKPENPKKDYAYSLSIIYHSKDHPNKSPSKIPITPENKINKMIRR